MINSVFFYLFFGPFLLDLPSVISSGTFLAREEYTKANTAISVHFITLGGVLIFATGIFYFTVNQLAKAIEEYTVPSELTLVHVGVVPVADISGGQTFTLSPLTDSEKEDEELWDTSLARVRHRVRVFTQHEHMIIGRKYIIICIQTNIPSCPRCITRTAPWHP